MSDDYLQQNLKTFDPGCEKRRQQERERSLAVLSLMQICRHGHFGRSFAEVISQGCRED